NQSEIELLDSYIDRYLITRYLCNPARSEEKLMHDAHVIQNALYDIRPVFSKDEIIELQSRLSAVEVNDAVQDYALDIIHSSRNHGQVETEVWARIHIALV